MKVKSLTRVRVFVTSWTVTYQAPLCPWDFPDKSTEVGCHFLLQGIFPTQGSNQGLLYCRQTLNCLSHQGSLNNKWKYHSITLTRHLTADERHRKCNQIRIRSLQSLKLDPEVKGELFLYISLFTLSRFYHNQIILQLRLYITLTLLLILRYL